MLAQYIRIKLKHFQEPKNRGLIADIGPPEKKGVPALPLALSPATQYWRTYAGTEDYGLK
jgi:hypothetical protein